MWSKVCFSSLLVGSRSVLNTSVVFWSVLRVFPFLSIFSAAPVSFVVGVSSEIPRPFTSSYSSYGGDSVVSLLRISSKRSLHLVSLASLFFTSFPSFFFLPLFVCSLLLSVSCFTYHLYSSFCHPFSAAFCAFSTFSAIHTLLSLLHFSWLHCLSPGDIFRQSGLDSFWSCAVCVLMIFLSSISFRVFSLIMQGLPFKRVRWSWPFLDCI